MTNPTPEQLSENDALVTAFRTALAEFKQNFMDRDKSSDSLHAVAMAYRHWEASGIWLDKTNHYNKLIEFGCTDQQATTIMNALLDIMLNEEAEVKHEARKAQTLSKTALHVKKSTEDLLQDGAGI